MKCKITLLASLALILLNCSASSENTNETSSMENSSITKSQLDPNLYEIIKIDERPILDNYYILLKMENFTESSLNDFAIKFKAENCSRECNIQLFDSNTIEGSIGKYPLENSEYLNYADHFVASLSFESSEIWWYPYQDFKYKELGGSNWKKEPVK